MEESPTTIYSALRSKNNGIGGLRLALALLVLFSHGFTLGGFGDDPLVRFSDGNQGFGELAVAGFFFLSGVLVTRSFCLSRSVWRFLRNRFLRIFPGYWVCLLVTALVFGPIAAVLQNGSLNGYFNSDHGGPLSYLVANSDLSLRQYAINGLPRHVPYSDVLDGSLWTLHNEFLCYLCIAVLGVCGVLKRWPLLVVLLALCLLVLHCFTDRALQMPLILLLIMFGTSGIEQALCFFIGSTWYLYRDRLPVHGRGAIVAACLLILTLRTPLTLVVFPCALSYVLLWLSVNTSSTWLDERGDFSYGVYIYAFAVQQLLVLAGVNRYGFLVYLALTLMLTFSLAILSWRWVEQPCLAFKNARAARPQHLPLEAPQPAMQAALD